RRAKHVGAGRRRWDAAREGAVRNVSPGGGTMTKIGPRSSRGSVARGQGSSTRPGIAPSRRRRRQPTRPCKRARGCSRAQPADLAVQAGSRLYTDSASSSRALKGYVHAFVNHTQKEYARGDVHENRAECLFSLLKPYLRVFRGISKLNLPGSLGFFQFLRNVR